jgi:hypothetical protein
MLSIHPNKTGLNFAKAKKLALDAGDAEQAANQQLIRLAYTCQGCGLTSRPHKKVPDGYLEVVHIDGRAMALCTMCMQAIHLSRVHQSSNHGLIIYAPSLSQGRLIRYAQLLYLAKLRNNRAAPVADQLINDIQAKGVAPLADGFAGLKTGALAEFINLWDYASPRIKQNADSLFEGLRYWPFEMPYRHQLKFWQMAAFKHLSDEPVNSVRI